MDVVLDHWQAALDAHEAGAFEGGTPVAHARLGPPVPGPRSVYAIGLNYRNHARETGASLGAIPPVFTEITGLGVMRNTCVAEPAPARRARRNAPAAGR